MGMSAGGPDLIQDGLVLCLDAGDRNSYQSGSLSWFDLSGNNNSGSLVNGPTFNTGSFGSIVFDGVNDYCTLNTGSINAVSNFSVCYWINRKPTASNVDPRIFIIGVGGVSGYGVGVNKSNLHRFTKCGIIDIDVNVTSSLNTWECISWTVGTDNKPNLYVNGVIIFNSPNISAITPTTSSAYLGVDVSPVSLNQYYSGSIALFQIYNRALTPVEIQQNYNSQKSRFGLT